MSTTAAIFYAPEVYKLDSQRLLGRQSANAGFLKAWIQNSRVEPLYCCIPNREAFTHFQEQISLWTHPPRTARWVPMTYPQGLAEVGTLFHPDPQLAHWAWQRRFYDQRGYSICGITHTVSSLRAMQEIGALAIAPMQPWDALICPSQSVKTSVLQILEPWIEYLGDRTGGKPTINWQMPVIPLGIDWQELSSLRQIPPKPEWRQSLGIAPDDVVVLYVGRLSASTKAHPIPMYLALENAAQQTQVKLHLLQVGWCETQEEAIAFQQSALLCCPSVSIQFMDGRKPEERNQAWAISDIFVSLADNVQETFGLTPVEAMAVGLPVIVADWNGYRESVRHEVDGFRIATLMPPKGAGESLAAEYWNHPQAYQSYVGQTAMATAVDLTACTKALVTLIKNPDLRRSMGEAGMLQARNLYDWSVVIAAYEELWQELGAIRSSVRMCVPVSLGKPPHPLCDDPFQVFGNHASTTLTLNTLLKVDVGLSSQQWQQVEQHWADLGEYSQQMRICLQHLLEQMRQREVQTVEELVTALTQEPIEIVWRALGMLLKLGCIRVINAVPKRRKC